MRPQKHIHQYYDFAGGVARKHKAVLPGLPKSLNFQLEIFLRRHIFLRVPFFQVGASACPPAPSLLRQSVSGRRERETAPEARSRAV